MSTCHGCGVALPPNKAPGRTRKWCSDRCRKSQYDKACIDCGARVDGTTPGRAAGRCRACAAKIPKPAHVIKRATVEALWADGHTQRHICEFMGIKFHTSNVSTWRSRGYDLPHRRTPEQIARITVSADERLAKARAVYAEMKKAA